VILTFEVYGAPAPKGSLKPIGNGRLVEQVKAAGPWMTKVRAGALEAAHQSGWQHDGAGVLVEIEFVLPRPKTVARPLPITRSAGDVDKLSRAVLDALTVVPPKAPRDGRPGKPGKPGVITDDSVVVGLVASKRYPSGPTQFIGARITVKDVSHA
jgi:Holliday junction resolvase RusA-like endonuclease